MKIRNGFVSNSSSSSYILSYQKSKVIEDPRQMVAFFNEHPDAYVVFYGKDWGEGKDIFEMDSSQKKLVRKFPEDFVETIEGLNCKLIPQANLVYNDIDYTFKESDVIVPDMEYQEISEEEYMEYLEDKDNAPKELKEKIANNNEYYERREKLYEKEYEEKNKKLVEEGRLDLIKQGVPENDAYSEEVWISHSSCTPIDSDLIDFASRYVSDTVYDECDYVICNEGLEKPYVVFYDELIEDKYKILLYLEKCNKNSINYIFWSNPIYNMATNEEYDYYDTRSIDIDYYEIGPQELDILREKLLSSKRKVYLVTNATITIGSSGENPRASYFKLGFGRPAVIKAGTDLVDFKGNFEE